MSIKKECGNCGNKDKRGVCHIIFNCDKSKSEWKPKLTNSFDDICHPIVPEGSAKTSSHYQVGTKQPIEVMQDVMTREELIGFLRGNVIKYALRLGHKDEAKKEAGKVEQYAKWLRIVLSGGQIDPRL